MPNHIQNILYAPSHVLKAFKNDDDEIDFNKIIPMPESLANMDHSSDIETVVDVIFGIEPMNMGGEVLNTAFQNLAMNNRLREIVKCKPMIKTEDDKKWEQLITALNNQRTYGCFSWYDWSPENWGTKWNAYSQPNKRSQDDKVLFQTAWSPPIPIIKALSKKFPEAVIKLECSDEDTGSQCYEIEFLNGEEVSRIEHKDRAAKIHYFWVWEDTREPTAEMLEDHGMDENFEYVE